jgi:DNA-binding SARP family transcriptional activator
MGETTDRAWTDPRFRILGPMEVAGPHGGVIQVRQPLQRAALATLLVFEGAPCPRPVLARALWNGSPPADVPGSLRTLMHSLRRTLSAGEDELLASGGGYLLRAGESDVDARLFRSLAAKGRRAWYDGDAAGAARLLGTALRLWREPGLDALPDAPALADRRHLLLREHRDVQDLRADALLALGRLDDVIPALRDIVAADPGREHAWALLARALAATGNRAGAAATLGAGQAALASEYGGRNGPELDHVARQILRSRQPGWN